MILATALTILAAATPTPAPSVPNPSAVTPGLVGFLAFFAIVLVTVGLVFDMTRRVRRVRYRAEIAERLAAEESGDDFRGPGGPGNGSQPHDPDAGDPGAHDPEAHDPEAHDPEAHDPQAGSGTKR